MTSAWFPYPSTPDETSTLLFCLPHAGAGASAYRAWAGGIPNAEVVAVQLPGRESRFTELPRRSAGAIVPELTNQVLARSAGHRRIAIFGHSMGALLGFELAYALTAAGRALDRLIVSAYRAPHLARPGGGDVRLLPDDRLAAHLERMEGTQAEVLRHPDLLALILPTIRADYTICEEYAFTERAALRTPILALGGTDDPGVATTHLDGWAQHTTGGFERKLLPGGHFYLHNQLPAVLSAVAAALTLEDETHHR